MGIQGYANFDMKNTAASLGIQWGRRRSRSRRNKRRANHNAQIALRLNQENQTLKGEVGRLRQMLGQYQTLASRSQAPQQHFHHYGASRPRMAAFSRQFLASPHALLHAPVIGGLGAVVGGDLGSLRFAARATMGRVGLSIHARANMLNFAAFHHARHAF